MNLHIVFPYKLGGYYKMVFTCISHPPVHVGIQTVCITLTLLLLRVLRHWTAGTESYFGTSYFPIHRYVFMAQTWRGGGGGAELFVCPYPLKVQVRPPRDQILATQSRVSGLEADLSTVHLLYKLWLSQTVQA